MNLITAIIWTVLFVLELLQMITGHPASWFIELLTIGTLAGVFYIRHAQED